MKTAENLLSEFIPNLSQWIDRLHNFRRSILLDPNRGSRIKVENYELPLSCIFTIGTQNLFLTAEANPLVEFKPMGLVCNVPAPNFVYIYDIKAANVSASISHHTSDAWIYNPSSIRSTLNLPRLLPQNNISIHVLHYDGCTCPCGFILGTQFRFTATFFGPAEMASR